MDKDDIIVSFKSVSKVYDNGVTALNDVSVDIKRGDFVFLVGPTGTGKSTLLKLINREEVASSGKIIVNNQDVGGLSPDEIPYLRRTIGNIFQDFKLLSKKTCYENVAYALRVIGAGKREIAYKVPRALKSVALESKEGSFVEELSGGEKQRVAIARALVNNPLLILADEPTGNLDPDTSWDITELLLSINSHGTTVIMATHDKSIVNRTRKRVIVLQSDGTVFSDRQKGSYIHEL